MNARWPVFDVAMGAVLLGLLAVLPFAPQALTSGPTDERRFEQLSHRELAEIKNSKRRYDAMPEQKQQRLRELHRQLAQHPDREALLATMRAWYDWLGKLENEAQRTRLRGLEPADRVAEVQRIRLRQAEEFFGFELPRADVQKLFSWTAEFVKSKQEKIDELFSQSMSERTGSRAARREWMARRPDIQFVILYNIKPDLALSLINSADLDHLKSSLSNEGNRQLGAQVDDESRKRLVYRWVISAIEAQRRPPPWELKNFYEFEMSAEQKQRVDNMDRQQRQREITRLYNASRDRGQFGIPDSRTRRGTRPGEAGKRNPPGNDN